MTTPQVILNVRYDDDPTVHHVLYRPDSQGEDLNRKVNTLFESKYPDGEFEIYVDLSPEGVTPRVRIDKATRRAEQLSRKSGCLQENFGNRRRLGIFGALLPELLCDVF